MVASVCNPDLPSRQHPSPQIGAPHHGPKTTHGRSVWVLDDVTELRGLVSGRKGTRLFSPRTAIRPKLDWSAGANVRSGIAAFGIACLPAIVVGLI